MSLCFHAILLRFGIDIVSSYSTKWCLIHDTNIAKNKGKVVWNQNSSISQIISMGTYNILKVKTYASSKHSQNNR